MESFPEGTKILANTNTENLSLVVFVPLLLDEQYINIFSEFIKFSISTSYRNYFNFVLLKAVDRDEKINLPRNIDPHDVTGIINSGLGGDLFDMIDFEDLYKDAEWLRNLKIENTMSQVYFRSYKDELTSFLEFNFLFDNNKSATTPLYNKKTIFDYITDDSFYSSDILPEYVPEHDLGLTAFFNNEIENRDYGVSLNYGGYNLSWNDLGLDDPDFWVTIEMAFMIPLEFAVRDGDVVIEIENEIFDEDDDDIDSILDTLDSFNNLEIRFGMNKNPFSGIDQLNVDFGNNNIISCRIENNSIVIPITNSTIVNAKDILFSPDIVFFLNEGTRLSVPSDLTINQLSFKGSIDFETDF